MLISDIIGPVMVGPSSSHTAGAVRIGKVCHKLLGETPREAEIRLHGSFLTTGKGHGTDRALIAGILGLAVDDARIPVSFTLAEKAGLRFTFGSVDLGGDAHPNSARIRLTGASGKTVTVEAASIGGGRIRVERLDGMDASFSGDYPTLIVRHADHPGLVARVSLELEKYYVNIANMQLRRSGRGGTAVMVLECDQPIPVIVLDELRELEGVEKVIYLNLGEEAEHV